MNLLNEDIELDKYFENVSKHSLVLSVENHVLYSNMFTTHCLNLIPPPSLETHNAQKFIKDSEIL